MIRKWNAGGGKARLGVGGGEEQVKESTRTQNMGEWHKDTHYNACKLTNKLGQAKRFPE